MDPGPAPRPSSPGSRLEDVYKRRCNSVKLSLGSPSGTVRDAGKRKLVLGSLDAHLAERSLPPLASPRRRVRPATSPRKHGMRPRVRSVPAVRVAKDNPSLEDEEQEGSYELPLDASERSALSNQKRRTISLQQKSPSSLTISNNRLNPSPRKDRSNIQGERKSTNERQNDSKSLKASRKPKSKSLTNKAFNTWKHQQDGKPANDASPLNMKDETLPLESDEVSVASTKSVKDRRKMFERSSSDGAMQTLSQKRLPRRQRPKESIHAGESQQKSSAIVHHQSRSDPPPGDPIQPGRLSRRGSVADRRKLFERSSSDGALNTSYLKKRREATQAVRTPVADGTNRSRADAMIEVPQRASVADRRKMFERSNSEGALQGMSQPLRVKHKRVGQKSRSVSANALGRSRQTNNLDLKNAISTDDAGIESPNPILTHLDKRRTISVEKAERGNDDIITSIPQPPDSARDDIVPEKVEANVDDQSTVYEFIEDEGEESVYIEEEVTVTTGLDVSSPTPQRSRLKGIANDSDGVLDLQSPRGDSSRRVILDLGGIKIGSPVRRQHTHVINDITELMRERKAEKETRAQRIRKEEMLRDLLEKREANDSIDGTLRESNPSLTIDEVSDIVAHINLCKQTNTPIRWDLINDIVFPDGIEEEVDEDLAHKRFSVLPRGPASEQNESAGDVPEDHEEDVFKSFRSQYNLSEEKMTAVIDHLNMCDQTKSDVRWDVIHAIIYSDNESSATGASAKDSSTYGYRPVSDDCHSAITDGLDDSASWFSISADFDDCASSLTFAFDGEDVKAGKLSRKLKTKTPGDVTAAHYLGRHLPSSDTNNKGVAGKRNFPDPTLRKRVNALRSSNHSGRGVAEPQRTGSFKLRNEDSMQSFSASFHDSSPSIFEEEEVDYESDK